MAENEPWGVQPNDGYEMPLDEEQRLDYLKDKRERFIIKPAGISKEPEDNAEITSIEFEDQNDSYVDPHLQRAIEYLQSRRQ